MFDTEALGLTLKLASITTVLLLLLALPLCYVIVFARSRGGVLLEALVALPLVLPPTLLGYYLLVGLGPLTAVGRTLTHLLGHTLAFSFPGLVVGSMLYSLPFAVQPLAAGLRSVDPRFLDAAATLGTSPLASFLRVALPLARPSLLTSAVLTFAHTVGEFGVVLMLGGNIPGQTRTLSIVLYDLAESGDFAAANRIAITLLVLSTAALAVLYLRPDRRAS
ncbi:molybdate ABC transporter permease subunit [Terriglobus aquaticus]|uniref:Molybdenum transport system permease n=1 Tax=Terriglobus aquaticus TaxID=940139 RepID=A0ABW9KHV2_9BACT|nr:molybdate ABC transporter permease subunit [Terriglobus aquaticus]